MADGEAGWTVLFRDGAPADWLGAGKQIVKAARGRFTDGDANRAVRFGDGFVDLLLDADEAARIEHALSEGGFVARALRWAECEVAETAVRHPRIQLEGDEVVAGLSWRSVHFVHLVLAQSAQFFLPPDVNQSTKAVNRVAGLASVAVDVAGITDFGLVGSVKNATDIAMRPGTTTTSEPELLVELCGLGTPRVQLAVDDFDYACIPMARGGRRERLKALLQAVIARAPTARTRGLVELALARRSLEGSPPLPVNEHRRRVMAWLTAKRVWLE
jgi:hypothetical protein